MLIVYAIGCVNIYLNYHKIFTKSIRFSNDFLVTILVIMHNSSIFKEVIYLTDYFVIIKRFQRCWPALLSSSVRLFYGSAPCD